MFIYNKYLSAVIEYSLILVLLITSSLGYGSCTTGNGVDNNCTILNPDSPSEATVFLFTGNLQNNGVALFGFKSSSLYGTTITGIQWSRTVDGPWTSLPDITITGPGLQTNYATSGALTIGASGPGGSPYLYLRYTIPKWAIANNRYIEALVESSNSTSIEPDGSLAINGTNYAGNSFNNTASGGTTPISLSYFNSRQVDNEVEIEFATATEAGNLGFEIYVERNGKLVQIGDFIPSKVTDSVEPQFYRAHLPHQIDDRYYTLRDVNIFGLGVNHGPFEINKDDGSIPSGKPITWKKKGAEMRARARLYATQLRTKNLKEFELELKNDAADGGHKESKLFQTQAGNQPSRDLVTISVSENGVQRVTNAELLAAGLNLDGINVRRLRLYDSDGQIQPLRFEGLPSGTIKWRAGSAFTFIGQMRSNSLYGTTNIYRLRIASTVGATMPGVKGLPPEGGSPEPWFMDTLKLADQKLYAFTSPNGDPWYQTRMLSRATAYEVPLKLTGLVPGVGGATVEVNVWGGTDQSFEGPDHHLIASINGGAQTDTTFDGFSTKIITIDAGNIRDGNNSVTLLVPGDLGGGKTDLINLEGIQVSYPRNFKAGTKGLTFTAAGAKFSVSGLKTANPQVYRVNSEGETAYLTDIAVSPAEDGSYSATFAGVGLTSYTYYVIAGEASKPIVKPGIKAQFCENDNIDYLAIVHPHFNTPLLDGLLKQRRKQGFKVLKVTTDGIYAAYSGGLPDPKAIQECVKAAPNVSNVLLVGSDTYDPNNYLGVGSLSFVPTTYIQTDEIVKFAPCDSCYGFLDNKLKATVGRLPVRDNQELARLIAQAKTFESKTYRRKLVQASDAYDDAQGHDFKADAVAMRNDLPYDWEVKSIYMDDYVNGNDYDVIRAKADLKNAIEAGAAMTSYVGHSSYSQWSYKKLFTLSDALSLDVKGKPSLVTQWGCWNTYFVAPKFDTMAHALLLGGGSPGAAAAVMGAGSLASANEEAALGRKLSLSLSEPGITLGQAVMKAKQSLLSERPDYLGIVQGWTLLGDPGLVVDKQP